MFGALEGRNRPSHSTGLLDRLLLELDRHRGGKFSRSSGGSSFCIVSVIDGNALDVGDVEVGDVLAVEEVMFTSRSRGLTR
jgi:hypothetical protein